MNNLEEHRRFRNTCILSTFIFLLSSLIIYFGSDDILVGFFPPRSGFLFVCTTILAFLSIFNSITYSKHKQKYYENQIEYYKNKSKNKTK